jgi:hypothetical protein
MIERLGGQNLTEFVKILIPESLKYFINFFEKNKHMGIFEILAGFNSKSKIETF